MERKVLGKGGVGEKKRKKNKQKTRSSTSFVLQDVKDKITCMAAESGTVHTSNLSRGLDGLTSFRTASTFVLNTTDGHSLVVYLDPFL